MRRLLVIGIRPLIAAKHLIVNTVWALRGALKFPLGATKQIKTECMLPTRHGGLATEARQDIPNWFSDVEVVPKRPGEHHAAQLQKGCEFAKHRQAIMAHLD